MSALTLQVADRFAPGTKVQVHPRVHDYFTPGQTKAVKSVTVAKDGSVKLDGLVEHGPYFLAGVVDVVDPRGQSTEQWRSVAFTAGQPSGDTSPDGTIAQMEREIAARAEVIGETSIDLATAPVGHRPAVIEGPRDTSNVLPVRIEGAPKGAPLASHTATGEAVYVGEAPLTQHTVPKGAQQSSDTERGAASVIGPVPTQDEAKGAQASDTEAGVATTTEAHLPKPDAGKTTARKTAAVRDKSSKAPGAKKAKAAVKKTTRKSAAKRGRK